MPPQISNYMRKMDWLAQMGVFQRGEAYDVTWKHDDWCGFWTMGVCNCDPDVVIKPLADD